MSSQQNSHERSHFRHHYTRVLRTRSRLRRVLREGPLNIELAPVTILTMETIVIALLALATLGYLVVAVLCPEKF